MTLRAHPDRHRCKGVLAILLPLLALAGCSSLPHPSSRSAPEPVASRAPAKSSSLPALPRAGSGKGGYYQDDGPGDNPPEGLMEVPDAEPRIEPTLPRSNRPYVVFGKSYKPITDERPFRQRGIGSWYGKKFHGQKTSSGEPYDMYKMTAAHPTLPIPSYARVTNLATGKQVIVRINDRGPFHSGRIIDLSYTAALKLGYLSKGSSELEVERLLPDEIARIASDRREPRVQAEQALPTPEVLAAAAAVERAPRAEPPAPAAAAPDAVAGAVISVAPPVSPATAAPGFYLQLGSYSQPANAQAAQSRFAQSAGAALPPVEMVEYGPLYRLYSGPFASRADAAAAAQQLQEGGAFKPLVVQR